MTMDPRDRKSEADQGSNWERDLKAIQASYSRLEADEPPDLLDQAILNTARRELASSRRKPLRWIGAFATASVFVLALTLVVQQQPEPIEPGMPNGVKLDAAAPPEAQQYPRNDSAGSVSPDDGLQESRSMERSQLMKQSAPGKREDNFANEPVSAPASAAVVAEFEAAPAAAAKELPADAGNEVSADADWRLEDEPAELDSIGRFRDEEAELKAKTGPGTPLIEESAARRQSADKPADALGTAVASTEEKDESAAEQPDPEVWIQRLLLLNQSELYEQLEEEMAAFRKAYPDHPLPQELEN